MVAHVRADAMTAAFLMFVMSTQAGLAAGLVTTNESARPVASVHGRVRSAKKMAPKSETEGQLSVSEVSECDLTTQLDAREPILDEMDEYGHARETDCMPCEVYALPLTAEEKCSTPGSCVVLGGFDDMASDWTFQFDVFGAPRPLDAPPRHTLSRIVSLACNSL